MGQGRWIGVVASEEMERIERWAKERGADGEAFMHEAGRKVAVAAAERVGKGGQIGILVGKGNNGGDGYAAGCFLLKQGYRVRAYVLYEEASRLNGVFARRFAEAGGVCFRSLDLERDDLLIDALVGTGFRGELEPRMEMWIREANGAGKPIIAIDIPSGLNGTTGEARVAIRAAETVALGLAKIGFFLEKGWNWVGKLRVESYGLSDEALQQAQWAAKIPRLECLELPKVERVRHKYERGLVVGFGGSKEYQGAVKLSGLAALHAGAGIVKLFSLEEVGEAAHELICQVWSEPAWKEAVGKAKALFVGPGMGRSEAAKKWIEEQLGEIDKPCVIDADALFFLPRLKKWPVDSVLTPHRGEMGRMIGEVSLGRCQEFVDRMGVVLVLKGAPTFILGKNEIPVVVPFGDPAMATAGAGDVLTGMIASLIAQGKNSYDGAVLGVVLHALAGEEAARAKTSFGVVAGDLIEYLPHAFRKLL